ncbi:hypothetical protein TWF718_005931 [Orbilia javanica]|uniref:Uncharacterized protein n=1 Tax=Orbilia javanica TaxID=47235 RepID=A0AAN8REJ8_9PEZI
MESEDESIYSIACECKKLFADHTPDDPPSTIDTLLEDYEQRFLAWSAYLGVFAEKSICLDRRLRDRSDIRDIVIRLLDILVEALGEISNNEAPRIRAPDSPMDLGSGESVCSSDSTDNKSETGELLEDIEMSLTRLSHLGTTIRKYSSTSRAARISKFAEESNLCAFEGLARTAVNSMYPDASESLRAQLTKSMVETCASVLYKQSHQQKMNSPRLTAETPMPTISEVVEDTIQSQNIETPEVNMVDSLSSFTAMPPPKVDRLMQRLVSESAPSELNSLRTMVLRRSLDSSFRVESNCKASSIQIGKVTYPRAPRAGGSPGYLACEWCLERHPRAFFEDIKEWNSHIDKDFEPYVCLSEKCMDGAKIPCFPTFKEWLSHMNTIHTIRWQQEIHKPTFWVCNFGDHSTDYFDNPEDLHDHMKKCYPDSSITRLQAIANNSYIKRSRPSRVCPLCCRDLVQDKRKNTFFSTGTRKRRKAEDNRGEIQGIDTGEESEASDSDEKETESPEISMARHIASHLQILMFLTIRFIKCLGGGEGTNENTTSHSNNNGSYLANDTDSRASWLLKKTQAENDKDLDGDQLSYEDEIPAHQPKQSTNDIPLRDGGTFRASDIQKDTTMEELRELLMEYISSDEREEITISKLVLAPFPGYDDFQTAIVGFQGGTPAFLKEALIKRIFIWDNKGRAIKIDSHFEGLTQLYDPKENVYIEYDASGF